MTDLEIIRMALRPPVVCSARCSRCGDPMVDKPVRDFDCQVTTRGGFLPAPAIGICGNCLASVHDGKVVMRKAVHDGDGLTRDGWVDQAATDPEHRTELAVEVSPAKAEPGGKSKKERRRERVAKLGRPA